MRRYDDGAFIENEPFRRGLRDSCRDKFFGEIGIERAKDPFEVDTDPAVQLGLVRSLIASAKAFHGTDDTALTLLDSELAGGLLGISVVGASTLGRPVYAAMAPINLNRDFFSNWYGATWDEGGAMTLFATRPESDRS